MSQAADSLREDIEDPYKPSVDSENPEERIAARRLRIATRNDSKKRQELGDETDEKKEVQEEMRRSQHQVEQSEKRMIQLQNDGTELVTNIQIATDARESQRRADLEETRKLGLEKLEVEAQTSLEQFEKITKKWTAARLKEFPQDLQDALNSQQKLCGQLIEDKNKLIIDLQQEMKACDDRYVKDLKKQGEDIDLLIERMEDQVKNLMKSYREELDQIENSYEHERQVLMTGCRKKWEQLMSERRDKELDNLMQRMKRVEEYESSLQKLRVEDAEEYNMIKIKLDTDVQILEQQLQQMKATYQLNQEKLEYNFQVLKKRDEENTITKSQQKRKITRLQDVLNNMKAKCANQERQSREESQQLSDDYNRIMQQYKHMQKKMRHFAAIDAKRFEDVWLMNEGEVKELAEKALTIDQLIHEQQLGLAWQRPPLAFMEHCGPIQPYKQVRKTAHQAASELLRSGESRSGRSLGLRDASVGPGAEGSSTALEVYKEGAGTEGESERRESGGKRAGLGKVSVTTVKKLLDLLCDEAGFLIESKLLKLLSPLEKDKQSLMKLDAIFSAMSIESEEDIYKMGDFLLKFKQQQAEEDEAGSSCRTDGATSSTSSTLTSDLIHPNDVLVALTAFTSQHCRPGEAVARRQSDGPGVRDDSEDAAYWDSLAQVISEGKLRVWDALEAALEKYHSQLKERSKLITDTHSLKQQNSEMRMLLHQYINSKINSELEIPPTRLMQQFPE
ncbi:dynein regulatory complex protein 1 [Aplochiton taeniatus]